MISLPNDPTTYKPQRLWTGFGWSTLVILVALFFLFAVIPGVVGDIITSSTDAWHCITNDCDPRGPAVSWEEQLSVANAEITKISDDYVISSVEFGSAAFKEDIRRTIWNPDEALEVTFSYVISNGLKYDVSLWDVKPSATVKITRNNSMPSQNDYNEAIAKGGLPLERIKVSPRQATEHAWSTFRAQEGAGDVGFREGRLATELRDAWFVSFQLPDAEVLSQFYRTYFLVDIGTGEATLYNLYDRAIFPLATPTSTP